MECSNCAVKTAFDIQVDGKLGPGRPKMTWKQLTERDRREWKFSAMDPHDRDTWRSGVSHVCSKPVAWKGAHCCGYGPCTCMLLKNLMMMMMICCYDSHSGVYDIHSCQSNGFPVLFNHTLFLQSDSFLLIISSASSHVI